MELPLHFPSGNSIPFNSSEISIKFSVSIDDDKWWPFIRLLSLHRIFVVKAFIMLWQIFIHCYLLELLIFFIYTDKYSCHHGHCDKYACIKYHNNVHNNKFIGSNNNLRIIRGESINIFVLFSISMHSIKLPPNIIILTRKVFLLFFLWEK